MFGNGHQIHGLFIGTKMQVWKPEEAPRVRKGVIIRKFLKVGLTYVMTHIVFDIAILLDQEIQ